MPVIPGKSKKQIGYRIPPDIERKFDELIESGLFQSQTDIITAALREFFIREWVDERIKQFLISKEGKELIRKIIEEKD